jgi:hypothetical protein
MNTRSELFSIKHTPNIAEATYSTGDVMTEGESLNNAVAEPGSCSILQSITAIDMSDTGGTIYVIITDNSGDLGTVGSAINMADSAADNSMAIVELSNWTDVGGAQVCSKGNIGLICKASESSASKVLYYGVVNVSGGDIVIGSGEDIIFQFGFVRS